jgi:hypothetical protein
MIFAGLVMHCFLQIFQMRYLRSFRACVFSDFEHAPFSGMFLPDVEECKSAAETELDQSFEPLSEAISGIHGAMIFDKAS